ncbi:MAG: hypothetical protein FJZ78_06520 [Bacteroidetes bacterium]|nr:hypothetical protein [Bacteroidota bacterium]
MENFLEFLKILVPAAAVLYAMYLAVQAFINRDLESKRLDIRGRSLDTVLPIRLQAYERICLLLERLAPQSLLLRVSHLNLTARDYQRLLLEEIRNEFNHNVSQQLYMSESVWGMVKSARENLVMLINDSAEQLSSEASGLDLAKRIMEKSLEKNIDPTGLALAELKREIQQVF